MGVQMQKEEKADAVPLNPENLWRTAADVQRLPFYQPLKVPNVCWRKFCICGIPITTQIRDEKIEGSQCSCAPALCWLFHVMCHPVLRAIDCWRLAVTHQRSITDPGLSMTKKTKAVPSGTSYRLEDIRGIGVINFGNLSVVFRPQEPVGERKRPKAPVTGWSKDQSNGGDIETYRLTREE
jgi:hypothetical protein